jgi:hypothetical protein
MICLKRLSELSFMPSDIAQADTSRLVAIIAKKQVVEVWHIYRERTVFREREIDLPQKGPGRVRVERRGLYKRQILRQVWGHFVIRRYHATQIQPWMSSLGLTMLIPGTLLAAGSANQIMQVPIGLLVLQCALVTVGGLMALASGWRVLVRRLVSADGMPLESLGVSSHALGFPKDVTASDSVPSGFRRGRFKGSIHVEIPIGQWEVTQEYTVESEWPFAH